MAYYGVAIVLAIIACGFGYFAWKTEDHDSIDSESAIKTEEQKKHSKK